ncbi:response regulator [Sphingobacterium psychroaquaticum]|uniref:DNA-binding response regulator, NarL/FixJ family, contains REC and HTH domains n=1 Tax=Sphingobacterium psychroaquaticum TaxID=561061 RepID=A0A1X7KSQ1_9SPHI|nr:response regulator [Sphingobacterium psychroaquaticum]QBQ40627.1 response regulator transcription factor [Sphingobacterium psychroaquaticum]SMG44518.1 DNA-binding response regulator, NarL/FixJ family, contains REC and HTH domains [Sphingobacterium psychroaquaticum]
MFKKVLIAEDHEIANISVQKTLLELGIQNTKYVYYCDHAYTWLKNALRDGEPYDLLITDLIFEDDNTPQQLTGGIELIRAVKELQPDLKVIVLSSESRSEVVDSLFNKKLVNGYVRKARRDAQHLREALDAVYSLKSYQSPEVKESINEKNSHEFTNLDLNIIALLAQGIQQKNIPSYLQQRDIKPSGLSSVEKRLNLMREVMEFSKNEQLIAYCKDVGLI